MHYTQVRMGNNAELATVVQNFLPSYNAQNKLPSYKLRTLDAVKKCRTEYMGGHVEACGSCAEVRTAYNSCRNRHCPKCGAIDKEKWVMTREADLLPVKYFHVVFTIPDKLNELFLNNQQVMYNLLFTQAWKILKDFGTNESFIGGKIGATAILHTWGQNLQYHPHIHFVVPAGAIMPDNKWKHSRSRGKYLFPVEELSSVFRAQFVEQVRELINIKEINGTLPSKLFDKDWVVYAKQPFGGPEQVIKYLSRYTHRSAISNERITNIDDTSVTFTWKDYKQNYKKQVTSLPGEEFLRLFCLHILTPGFTRIRHYGTLSSAAKTKALAQIRKALKCNPPKQKLGKRSMDILLARMGIIPLKCKCCGGKMVIIENIPNKFRERQRAPPNNNSLHKLLTFYQSAV